MYLRWVVVLIIAIAAVAQTSAPPEPNPLPMPQDRNVDSYEIYSLLLEQGAKNNSWPPKYWLVDETTDSGGKHSLWSCASDEPRQGPQTFSPDDVKIAFNDPHYATPPAGHKSELSGVLDDFDMHCPERLALSADGFHTVLPVHLANKALEKRFTYSQTGSSSSNADGRAAPELEGVAGIARFSEVYFDTRHTRALVHQAYNCGEWCGGQGWKFLERIDGRWQLRKGFLGYVDYSH